MSFNLLIPEIYILAAAVVILVLRVFVNGAHRGIYIGIAFAGILFGIKCVMGNFSVVGVEPSVLGFNALVQAARILFFTIGGITVALQAGSPADEPREPAVFLALVLFNVVGASIAAASRDIIVLFCALELFFISSFFIAVGCRAKDEIIEAASKYFVLGIFSSALIALAFSYLYGLTGHTGITEIGESLLRAASAADTSSVLVDFKVITLVAVVLLVAVAIKLAAAPFHFWLPDVMESTSIPAAALFSVLPSGLFLVIVISSFSTLFPAVGFELSLYYGLLAILGICIGGFAAAGQSDIRRFLAYTSIMNMGFALVGIAVVSPEGMSSAFFYYVVCVFMNMGLFGVFAIMRSNKFSYELSVLNGMRKNSLALSYVTAGILCSFIGLPLFGGFVGKFYLVMAVVKAQLYPLAGIAVAGWFLSSFIYLRLIGNIFVNKPEKTVRLYLNPALGVVFLGCLIVVIAMGVFPEFFMDFAIAIVQDF